MNVVTNWIAEWWDQLAIPLLVFALCFIALLWLRALAFRHFEKRAQRTRSLADEISLQAVRRPAYLWCLIISLYLGLAVAPAPPEWKNPAGKTLWSLLVISLAIAALNLARSFIETYGSRLRLSPHIKTTVTNSVRASVLVVALLIVLDLWGVPTTPLLLLIALAALALVLAFRESIPNIFAGLQLISTQPLKTGDYVKLESGEEGYIRDISWRNTSLETLDRRVIILPNKELTQRRVINYGRPLRQAKEPFKFTSRTHLTELTGLHARNIREMVDTLKQSPDSIVYFHTHHFLEEHQYLKPELSNDFAIWVDEALGDAVLSERLASIDTFEFNMLGELRDRLVGVMEEYLTGGRPTRDALPGQDFFFLKSVSVILPTPYLAHDLREFVEALKKVSPGSLYFHIFESRLRLGKGRNDFSAWMQDSLGEPELAEEIARLNPYSYTLEGLRLALIQLAEKRIR